MNRRVFDKLASLGGVLIVVVLAVAGGLLAWGASFANSEVHNQLSQQQVYFPPASAFAHPTGHEVRATMRPYLAQYAGMPFGGVYAKASTAALAKPTTAQLQTEVQTIFKGTTLRAELLEAYGFSVFGNIASIAEIAAFILAGLMALLVAGGVLHARRTDETSTVFGPEPEVHPAQELVSV